MKIISLFSGAGSLDHGFLKAGHHITLAIDHDPHATTTHQHNHYRAGTIRADPNQLGPAGICELAAKKLRPHTPIGIIANPPTTNPPGILKNTITILKNHYDIRFILTRTPPALAAKPTSARARQVMREIDELGFASAMVLLNAHTFGVPQVCSRGFIIALPADRPVTRALIFAPTPNAGRTVRDAIWDLPEPDIWSPQSPTGRHHPNHVITVAKPSAQRASRQPLAWDEPAPITGAEHRLTRLHPAGHRRLSIHEAALLYGFPRQFVFHGPLQSQGDQLFNSTPPPLAAALARAITTALA